MCHIGCVRFAGYCGQMYRRHLFSYGGLDLKKLGHTDDFVLPCSLGGYPPFSEEIKKHTLNEQIIKGLYSFPKTYWKAVSPAGINCQLTASLQSTLSKTDTVGTGFNCPS